MERYDAAYDYEYDTYLERELHVLRCMAGVSIINALELLDELEEA